MNKRIAFSILVATLWISSVGCGGGGSSSRSNGSGGGTVSSPPLSITTTTLPDAVERKPYTASLTATGGTTPYFWSVAAGAFFPQGLALSSDGVISGTPPSTVFGDVVFTVTDSSSPRKAVSRTIRMTVAPELSVFTPSLPAGHINVPYDAIIQPSPFIVKTWTITAGQLPAGMQLANPSESQVEISGTATVAGSYTFTIQAESNNNPPQFATKTYVLDLDANAAILTSQIPDVVNTVPYQATLTAVNGIPPYHWAVLPPGLPPGITLNANTGVISGTFNQGITQSSWNPTFQVTDSASSPTSSSRQLAFSLLDKLTISGPQPYDSQLFANYYIPYFTAGGKAPFTWSIGSGSLPPGLTFSQTGLLFGKPSQLGTYSFTLKVADSTNPPQTALLTGTINIVPRVLNVFVSSVPTHVPVGVPLQAWIAADGGTPPYTWTLVGGSLPTGIQLDSTTGKLYGTPTSKGSFNFTVKVTDSGSPAQTLSPQFTMDVTSALGRNDTIAKATPIGPGSTFASLSPYADPEDVARPDVDIYKILATPGDIVEITTSAKRTLPSDPIDTVLELLDANGARLKTCNPPGNQGAYTGECLNDDIQQGVIQDSELWLKVPGTPGTQSAFYVKVLDWRGDARPDMTYYLNVSANVVTPLTITTANVPGAVNGSAYSYSLAKNGGTGSVTWTLAQGTLPPGITLSPGGILSGTTTVDGTYSFTVQATDSGNPAQQATAAFKIQVAHPVKITSAAIWPDACVGQLYSFAMQTTGGAAPLYWGFYSPMWISINFNINTGVFSGTSNITGTFSGTVYVTDSNGSRDQQTVTLTVKTCP